MRPKKVRSKRQIAGSWISVKAYLAFPSSCRPLPSLALLLSFCLADVSLQALLTLKMIYLLNSAFNKWKKIKYLTIFSIQLATSRTSCMQWQSRSQSPRYKNMSAHWWREIWINPMGPVGQVIICRQFCQFWNFIESLLFSIISELLIALQQNLCKSYISPRFYWRHFLNSDFSGSVILY